MRKGFTLIELLVVIGIVGLLLSMSAAAIFSARNKRTAKTAADQVKNVIMEAHAYAISPKTTAGTGNVYIVVTANSIKAQVNNVDIINPVAIPSNVTLRCYPTASANPCLSFLTSGNNTIGQVGVVGEIWATKNGTGEKYKVTVGQLSGNVTITQL